MPLGDRNQAETPLLTLPWPGVLLRWCVTGTPVGTDIADLKGQFNFLQLHPFTNKNFFNTYVKPAYSGSSWARSPAYVLLYMLGQCMIRHTKLQVRHLIFSCTVQLSWGSTRANRAEVCSSKFSTSNNHMPTTTFATTTWCSDP